MFPCKTRQAIERMEKMIHVFWPPRHLAQPDGTSKQFDLIAADLTGHM
jgi:hypothetical protein